MKDLEAQAQFVQELTTNQNRMYAYIYSLLGDHHRARDVLQETNLVLWRKAAEFRPGAKFLPWAFAIARFQVMAHTRDRGRDRMVLDNEWIDLIATELEELSGQFEDMRDALRCCLAKLPDASRTLIDHRYFEGLSIRELAERQEKTPSATKVALLRIRRLLKTCVMGEMTA